MSTRATYATKLNDTDCITEALKELCGPSNVTVRENTISARYQNRLASFRKGDDGMYTVTTAERPQGLVGVLIPNTDGDGLTVYKLGQLYGKAMVLKAMRSLKGTVVKDEVDDQGIAHIRIRTISFE